MTEALMALTAIAVVFGAAIAGFALGYRRGVRAASGWALDQIIGQEQRNRAVRRLCSGKKAKWRRYAEARVVPAGKSWDNASAQEPPDLASDDPAAYLRPSLLTRLRSQIGL